MEFIPMIIRAKAQLLLPHPSINPKKSASSKMQQPPLNNTHDGVQILFTIGHIPTAPSNQPRSREEIPVTTSLRILILVSRPDFKTPPASKPRIMVPNVGMKL